MNIDLQCPKCGQWIEILSTTPEFFECPWCKHWMQYVSDGEFVDGVWRNKSKLVDQT